MVSARHAVLTLGIVVVMASVLVVGSGASWRTERQLGAGTLVAGRLDLKVGGVDAYSFTALSGTNLAPGSYRQAPLVVSNAGDIALRYRLAAVTFGTLTGSASYTATRVAAAAGCPTTGNPTALAGSATTFRTLVPAAVETWCLRVTLGPNPPQALSGAVVRFTYAGEQARHAA
ncbi:MAG: hypothetical protein Q7T56_15955 [Nocardioidaceae bacterium]|nr:hypothetical protein [Nocardioidaceae bacterium]